MKNLWSIFKEKVDSTATPMQEGDWQAMETLLDETQIVPNKGRRMRWGLLSVFLISLVGISAVLFLPAESEPATDSEFETISNTTKSTGDTAPENNTISSDAPSTYPSSDVPDEPQTQSPIQDATSNSEYDIVNAPELSSESSATSPSTIVASEDVSSDVFDDQDDATGNEVQPAQSQNDNSESLASSDESQNPSEVNSTPEITAENGATGEVPTPNEILASDSRMESAPAQESTAEAQPGEPMASVESSDEVDASENAKEAQTEPASEEFEDSEEPEPEIATEDKTESSPVIRKSSDRNHPFWIEANLGAATSVNTALNTFDGGIAFGYRNKGWTAQVGLQVANTSGNVYTPYNENVVTTDTSIVTRIDTSYQQRVIETWVITGWYTGEFVYDTVQIEVIDTVQFVQTDTSSRIVIRQQLSKVQTTYIQIPVLGGYEWTSNEWSFGIQAGINFRSVTYSHPELIPTTGYGLDALFRPYIGYSWNDRWTVYLRTNVAVPLSADPLLNRNNFTRVGLNVGVGYSF